MSKLFKTLRQNKEKNYEYTFGELFNTEEQF